MQIMLILMPLVIILLMILLFSRSMSTAKLANALIKAHVVVFLFIGVTTEGLSFFKAIRFLPVIVVWLVLLTICITATLYLLQKGPLSMYRPQLKLPTGMRKLIYASIAFLLTTTFFTAVLYPPNNWDSMTYRLARVANWINNESVVFYATSITRQNYMMPLAEYAILHLQILTGFDWYANIVQWFCYFVLICAGVKISIELGLDDKGKLFTAVAIATIPMVILQASSTQNDLVVSSFVVIFALYMLRLIKQNSLENIFFASAALGLALLTKGTAYLFCAGMGVALGLGLLYQSRHKRKHFVKMLLTLLLIVIFALLVNTGHLYRNYELYGHPMSTESVLLTKENVNISTLVANLFRNGALHIGTPFRQINSIIHFALGLILGPQLDNPQTVWPGTTFRIPFSLHEDTAGNILHMFIIIIIVIVTPFTKPFVRNNNKVLFYSLGIILGALIYCLLMKWQPWASRLHTPLFILTAPLMAMYMSKLNCIFKGYLAPLAVFILIAYSMPFALNNSSRSLISMEWYHQERSELYFANRYNLYDNYKTVVNSLIVLEPNEEVALYLDGDDWEYPFWALTQLKGGKKQKIAFYHVGVQNISGNIERHDLAQLPGLVLTTLPLDNWSNSVFYSPKTVTEQVSLYEKIKMENK